MLELFELEFMQRALWASVLASISCGVVGSLVVVNRLSFMAGGIAHTAYGGVGLATFFGLPLLPVTVIYSMLAAVLIGKVSARNKSRSDSTVGVIWALGMAMGVILVDLTPGYQGDLMSYLFGSILTVDNQDLYLAAILVFAVVLISFLFFKDLVALSFEEEYAQTRGIAVNLVYYLVLMLIAVTVVVTIQVVGLILVIALMTIPPQMAEQKATSLPAMMAGAILWSLLFCFLGLMLAYYLDLAAGASIIVVAATTYFAYLLRHSFKN